MLRLKNISVRNKLLLLSTTLLAAVVAVGATGYRGIMQLTELSTVGEQQYEAVRTIATVERSYDALRAVVLRAWIAAQRRDQSGQDDTAAQLQNLSETIIASFDVLETFSFLANDKARAIAANSEHTVTVSANGERALAKADEGLKRIHEKMESIADSVIHLGENSQAIADIIDAVNEIAEQSSLLAVNASIEAANAGEVGKGFAVIARAVKVLADQSKQATSQVQAILKDIQKASHIAVLVTEQGTKSVQVGVTQSREAGESIRTLSSNMAEAARAMTQIALSSEQQLVGVDQVVTAMSSIRRASAHNADSLKNIQAATQNLLEVGTTLEALVEQYTLTPNGAGNTPVATPAPSSGVSSGI